ncbi:hypothetical protein T10_6584 [Trichinella papuae]|uniref:Uncharacterized protein n=1 Tax=Trichinella papuae TaxID=268474 RepID=A0A0V1MZB8_9BILA|nr:hypothetical protein T10_6584 [Trichinella papuae]
MYTTSHVEERSSLRTVARVGCLHAQCDTGETTICLVDQQTQGQFVLVLANIRADRDVVTIKRPFGGSQPGIVN